MNSKPRFFLNFLYIKDIQLKPSASNSNRTTVGNNDAVLTFDVWTASADDKQRYFYATGDYNRSGTALRTEKAMKTPNCLLKDHFLHGDQSFSQTYWVSKKNIFCNFLDWDKSRIVVHKPIFFCRILVNRKENGTLQSTILRCSFRHTDILKYKWTS